MFTPVETGAGSVLLHLGTSTLLFSTGSILGASSLLGSPTLPENIPILAGTLASAVITKLLFPSFSPAFPTPISPYATAVSGFLVGLGTRWAGGCTSGHMLCGVPRLSVRSWIATLIFFPAALATTHLLNTAPACVGGLPCYTAAIPNSQTTLAIAGVIAAAYALVAYVKQSKDSNISRFVSGLLFGAGLILTGMAGPGKTLGFLSMGRLDKFDPSMALVAGIAVGGNALKWAGKVGKGEVWAKGEDWKVPTRKDVDWKLVVGSLLFGIGWGLQGICPGPGILGLVFNGLEGVKWVGAFIAGRQLADKVVT